jgi:hypothetical protein
MPLENFAVLVGTATVDAGATFMTQNEALTNTADVGLTTEMSIDVGGLADLAGKLRFAGAQNLTNLGVLNDAGITQDDTSVGVIATIPSLIQSYMTLAPRANQVLANNSPFATTVIILPGITLIPSDYTADSTVFQFAGRIDDTYVILIQGNATFDDCSINVQARNVVWVIGGNSHGSDGSLFFGTFLGPPANTFAGTFLFAGAMCSNQGGALTLAPGRIAGGPGSSFEILAATGVSITTPVFLAFGAAGILGRVDPGQLFVIPLPDPLKC